MEYPVSARVLGMGEAFVGMADDVNCLNYNPAGLNLIPSNQIGLTYLKGLSDTFYTNLGFAMPIGQDAGAGLSVGYLDGGQMDVNAIDGSSHSVRAQQDILVGLSGGMRISQQNMMGITIKVLSSTLVQEYKALTVAFDGGILYALMPDLQFGFMLKNLGPNIKYSQAGDPLPTTISTGVGYYHRMFDNHDLHFALDVRKPLDLDFQAHAGVEYVFAHIFSVRAGYKYGHDLDNLTAGAGVEWDFVRLDYAAGLMGELGLNHYISMLFTF